MTAKLQNKKNKQIKKPFNIRDKLKHGRSKSSKSMFILSDVHDGSNVAICSPEPYLVNQGLTIKPRKINREIYDFLIESKDQLENGKPYICILNGEPVDGADNKGRARGLWSGNVLDQINDSVKIIKKLPVQNNNWFLTRGSGYHTMLNGNVPTEEVVAEKIGARRFSMYDDENSQRYTDYVLQFKLNGRGFNVAHPIAGSLNFMYRATPLAKEMMIMKLEEGRAYAKEESPTVIVRSHTHHYVTVSYKNSFGWITAGLTLANEFQFNQNIGGKFPDIGVLELIVEPNGKLIANPIHAPESIGQYKTYDL